MELDVVELVVELEVDGGGSTATEPPNPDTLEPIGTTDGQLERELSLHFDCVDLNNAVRQLFGNSSTTEHDNA